jgi:hypothetical protein
MLHLVFGNAIIGLIEGLLLGWMFKCSKLKAVLILCVANYASAWFGFFVVRFLPSLVEITIQSVWYWFLAFLAVAFIVTLLIEFPFFWFALRSPRGSLFRSLIATVIIHGISYALLVGWYGMASRTSMMTKLEIVDAGEMQIPEPFFLYYISPEGDQVRRMNLNETGSVESIAKVAAHHHKDRLFVRPRDGTGYDLQVFLYAGNWQSSTEARVLEDFSGQAPVDWRFSKGISEGVEPAWFNYSPVPSIGGESDWEFQTGFWPGDGIRGKNEKTGERIHYSLELPFVAWAVRSAAHVTGDYLVAQLGADQICMIHPESGRIALIARGKGPIVAKPKRSNHQDAAKPAARPDPKVKGTGKTQP